MRQLCEFGARNQCGPVSVGRFFGEIGGDPEHGPEQVAVILQSALMLDNALVEASLVAQVKAPNPV
jgi:hypothetical protein